MMLKVQISGMGRYLPKNKVLSTALDEKMGLPLGSFESKSGLISRYFACEQETTSYMASQAAIEAVHNAGLQLLDIDVIIAACGASEQLIPSTASLIQKQLGLENSGIPCFDINSTCLSFLTALDVASSLIHATRYKNALVVSSDIPSLGINWNDMETCSIFGDGAAACILEPSAGSSQIISSHMETHSIGSDFCKLEAGGTRIPPSKPFDHQKHGLFHMDGKKVFKLAKKLIINSHEQIFKKAELSLNDIAWVIPHQASLLAMRHIRKQLNIPAEKFVDIYATHGNQMAASIPTVLYSLIQNKQLKRGQLIYLLGTGAGISANAMILEY